MPTTPDLEITEQPIFDVQLQALSEGRDGNGVAGQSDLKVTDGTGDNESDIATGTAIYDGSEATNGSVSTVTHSDGDGSDPRWDLIAYDVAGGQVVLREGTPTDPASNPVTPPDLQSDEVLLSTVYVEANQTDFGSSDIVNFRVLGGTGVIASNGGTTVVDRVREIDAKDGLTGSDDGGGTFGLALTNDSVTVSAGDGLRNGGTVTLGETTTLNIEAADIAGNALEDNGNDDLAVASNGIDTDELASGAVTDTEVASSTAISRDKLQGKHQTVTVSSDHTATNYERVLADASSNAVSVTLPAPSTALNVTVKAIDATNDVAVATPGSETIDGDAQRTITEQYVALTLTSDGSNYYIV